MIVKEMGSPGARFGGFATSGEVTIGRLQALDHDRQALRLRLRQPEGDSRRALPGAAVSGFFGTGKRASSSRSSASRPGAARSRRSAAHSTHRHRRLSGWRLRKSHQGLERSRGALRHIGPPLSKGGRRPCAAGRFPSGQAPRSHTAAWHAGNAGGSGSPRVDRARSAPRR